MDDKGHKKGKIYYSMGEVSEMFDVNPSLIRYWESKFDIIKPHKNKKGNRLFTPADVDNLKLIYHLVKEKGMTLQGAQKRIKDNKEGLKRDMEVVERLQAIRSMLMEIREELKTGSDDIVFDGYDTLDESQRKPENSKTPTQNNVETKVVPDSGKPPVKKNEAADDGISFEIDIEAMWQPEEREQPDGRQEASAVAPPVEAGAEQEAIVASAVQALFEEEPVEPRYIAELSEELAEEAETAAEVMEALAALEKNEGEQARPQVYEQTLF